MENVGHDAQQPANNFALELLTEEQLNRHLDLTNSGSCSLQMLLQTASANLCFAVEIERDKNVVILRQTGTSDWWNRSNPRVSVGYENIVRIEGEPRFRRICVTCALLSALRQALQQVQEAQTKPRFLKKSVRPDLGSISTWHIASAIVVLHTLRGDLRVRSRYIRWCEPDMKHGEGFEVDGPVCLSAEVPMTVNGTLLSVKIDDVLMLQLNGLGRVPRSYMGKAPLCAKPKHLILKENGEIDEFNSEWDVSKVFLHGSDEVTFSVSPVNTYLH